MSGQRTYYLCDVCGKRDWSQWSHGQLVLKWCSSCGKDTSQTRDPDQEPPKKERKPKEERK